MRDFRDVMAISMISALFINTLYIKLYYLSTYYTTFGLHLHKKRDIISSCW